MSSAIGNDDVRDYMGTLVVRTTEILESGIDHSVNALADEIIDLYHRRQLAAAAAKAMELAGTPSQVISTQDLHRKMEDLLVKLPSSGDSNKIRTAGEITLETVAHAEKIYETGETPGVYSGYQPFDRLVGPMVDGDLVVIGGATSAGKTALAQQIAFLVSQEEHVLIMSLEMTPRQWNNRYITQLTKIPAERLEMGPYTDMDFELIETARRDTLDNLKMVIGGYAGMTVSQIAAYARRVKRRFGLKLLVIDHLGFIRHQNPQMTGPDKIADITMELKAAAAAIGVPILLVSHINRDCAKRDNYRPQLSDLYGSSAIEKDADVVLFVHRLHYWLHKKGPDLGQDRNAWEADMRLIERDAELILAKRRRGMGGGIVPVEWDPERTLFI